MGWRRGCSTGSNIPDVRWSRSATTASRVKAALFYDFCCCRHQLVGAGELGVRLTFTAVLRAKVMLSAAVSKQEQSGIGETGLSRMHLFCGLLLETSVSN